MSCVTATIDGTAHTVREIVSALRRGGAKNEFAIADAARLIGWSARRVRSYLYGEVLTRRLDVISEDAEMAQAARARVAALIAGNEQLRAELYQILDDTACPSEADSPPSGARGVRLSMSSTTTSPCIEPIATR